MHNSSSIGYIHGDSEKQPHFSLYIINARSTQTNGVGIVRLALSPMLATTLVSIIHSTLWTNLRECMHTQNIKSYWSYAKRKLKAMMHISYPVIWMRCGGKDMQIIAYIIIHLGLCEKVHEPEVSRKAVEQQETEDELSYERNVDSLLEEFAPNHNQLRFSLLCRHLVNQSLLSTCSGSLILTSSHPQTYTTIYRSSIYTLTLGGYVYIIICKYNNFMHQCIMCGEDAKENF